MIYIIFAPPRYGKTSLMAHILNHYAFDRERIRNMKTEILLKNQNGFNLSIPQHCVAANFDCTFHKFRYSIRKNRRINPYRLGFENEWVKTHFSIPYEVYGITEAQKYFNSRMSLYYPDWQSRFFEAHGHAHLDFFLDTHRPNLIDPNVRDLAKFIEIISLKKEINDYGKVEKATWTIRAMDNSAIYEKYVNSGKTDKSCYTEHKIVANYDVFSIYNSFECKPKFYNGHLTQDFDLQYSKVIEETFDGYVNYLKENDDELPKNFYIKRSEK